MKNPVGDGRVHVAAWNAAAPRYAAFWGERLQPLRQAAVDTLQPPAEGPLAVAGCGPGDEVMLLCSAFPGRSIVAADHSPAMLSLLMERVRRSGVATVIPAAGLADGLSDFVRQAAGVLSCFALDVLADPVAALADWSACLRSGGSIAAVFWPRPHPGSARALLHAVLQTHLGYGQPLWEERALDAIPGLSLELTRDERVRRDLTYRDPEEYFSGMIEAGPLRFLQEMFGPEMMRECRDLWLVHHGLERAEDGWVDRTEARLWVLRRSG